MVDLSDIENAAESIDFQATRGRGRSLVDYDTARNQRLSAAEQDFENLEKEIQAFILEKSEEAASWEPIRSLLYGPQGDDTTPENWVFGGEEEVAENVAMVQRNHPKSRQSRIIQVESGERVYTQDLGEDFGYSDARESEEYRVEDFPAPMQDYLFNKVGNENINPE